MEFEPVAEIFLQALLWLNQLQSISPLPQKDSTAWVGNKNWTKIDNNQSVFEARSTEIADLCHRQPEHFVKFPLVPYGAQELYIDGILARRLGSIDMSTANFIFDTPIVDCDLLSHAKEVKWKIYSYSQYYTRFSEWPKLVDKKEVIWARFLGRYLYVAGASGLLILFILALSLLPGREPTSRNMAFFLAIASAFIYNLASAGPAFGLPISMLLAHKLGDSSISLSVVLISFIYFWDGLIPSWTTKITLLTFGVSSFFWVLGDNGDMVQFGSNLMYLPVLISISLGLMSLFKNMLHKKTVESFFGVLFGSLFLGTLILDALANVSILTYSVISFGSLFGLMLQLMATRRKIDAAYSERDYLRSSLELQVKEKTEELAKVFKELQQTNLDLVQSAKFASLGTLSAGVVHQISNSTNYIKGSLKPLEIVLEKLKPFSIDDYEAGRALLSAVQTGVEQTIQIIKALKQFTGLNQSKLKQLNISESIETIKTILGPRLKEKHLLQEEIEAGFFILGDVAILNQILVTLVNNAIDAMPNGGEIKVRAFKDQKGKHIEVCDRGDGIESEILPRIFDPLFTTKHQGKGAGLSLFMVSYEIKQLNGEVSVQSKMGFGTTFKLTFQNQ